MYQIKLNFINQQINHVRWSEVLIFYLVAVLFSLPFRLGLISMESLFPLPYGLNIVYRIFRAIGPFLGYLVMFRIVRIKVEANITFWGKNKHISLLSVLPIIAGITIAGVSNTVNLPERYYGFLFSMTLVFYALFEEYGWRGYLQQALKPLSLPFRIFLIGTLWYIWHLNFLNPTITLQSHLFQYFSLLLGAWGLLKISEVTNSLLFVASVHLIFNVLADVPMQWNAKIIIVLTAIIVWTALIFYLVRKEKDLLNQGK